MDREELDLSAFVSRMLPVITVGFDLVFGEPRLELPDILSGNRRIQDLVRLARRTSYRAEEVVSTFAVFGSRPSSSDFLRGLVTPLRDLEAVLVSLRILHRILVVVEPLPTSDRLTRTTRRSLISHWDGIASWCILLTTRIAPTLPGVDARSLVLLIGRVTLKALSFEDSLVPFQSTVDLSIQLWIAEDAEGERIILEDAGLCPVLDIITLCLCDDNCRVLMFRHLRHERLAPVVVASLLERVHLLSTSHTNLNVLIALKISSRYVEIGFKILENIGRDLEDVICKSQFFCELVGVLRETSLRELEHVRDATVHCATVPLHAFMVAHQVVYMIMLTSVRHRLRNFSQVLEAGIFDIIFSVFLPYFPWGDDEEDVRATAINAATVLFLHSPYQSAGLGIGAGLSHRMFHVNGLASAVQAHSAEGRYLIEACIEILDKSTAIRGVSFTKRHMCSYIECAAAKGKEQIEGSILQTCARCQSAVYCSKLCQKLDWRAFHKVECSRFGDPGENSSEFDRVPLRHGLELALYLEAICAKRYSGLALISTYPQGIFDVTCLALPISHNLTSVSDFLSCYITCPYGFHGRFLERVDAYLQDFLQNPHDVKLAHAVCTYGDGCVGVLARLRCTVSDTGRAEYKLMSMIMSARSKPRTITL